MQSYPRADDIRDEHRAPKLSKYKQDGKQYYCAAASCSVCDYELGVDRVLRARRHSWWWGGPGTALVGVAGTIIGGLTMHLIGLL